MTFLDENNAYLDCVNDEINTTSANYLKRNMGRLSSAEKEKFKKL